MDRGQVLLVFQFMPSTITNYAIDYNNDNYIDLKDNEDAYPSAVIIFKKLVGKKIIHVFIKLNNKNIPKKYLNISAKKIQ